MRSALPDSLRATVVISKETDPVLHAYLGSLSFGSASGEIRRLLNIAIKGAIPLREHQGCAVTSEETRKPAAHKTPSAPEQPSAALPTPAKPLDAIQPEKAATKEIATPDDLARIALLDDMS